MAIREILTVPDSRLKQVSKPVEGGVTDEIRALMDDMLETMYDAPGIGLAAIQIGEPLRVIVMDLQEDDEKNPRFFVNPEILPLTEDTAPYEEGCLSIPDQYADVTRPKVVDVEWLDRDGNLQTETFDGLWATCVQHEIDHLNGKLFIDYLKPLKRQMITRKMQKLKRERARS